MNLDGSQGAASMESLPYEKFVQRLLGRQAEARQGEEVTVVRLLGRKRQGRMRFSPCQLLRGSSFSSLPAVAMAKEGGAGGESCGNSTGT